jgi:ABC-2 type transport system permease protein
MAVPVSAIARKELQIQRRDPTALVLLFIAPLLLIIFVSKAFAGVLPGVHGYALDRRVTNVSPYHESVPRYTVMFAFFAAGFTAMGFYRERMWGTWDRILSVPITRGYILFGKFIPSVGIVIVQGVVLLFGGSLVFGLPIHSPWFVIGGVALLGMSASALGLLIALLTTTDQQVQQLNNLLVILLGAIGGAMAPLSLMPKWVQDIAPAVPQYWAVKLLNGAMTGNTPSPQLLTDAIVLVGFSIVLCGLTLPWFTPKRILGR